MRSNVYCVICGGPTTDSVARVHERGTILDRFAMKLGKLRDLNVDDVRWLSRCVAVYADFITRPGKFDRERHVLQVPTVYDDNTQDMGSDRIEIPENVYTHLPGHALYHCDYIQSEGLLSHELCIRLAAHWSGKSLSLDSPLLSSSDPAKVFWDAVEGPVGYWLCDAEVTNTDEVTDNCITQSRQNKLAVEKSEGIVLDRFWKYRYKFGYPLERPIWREGCGYDYLHKESYGITHLKRPDRFPQVYVLQEAAVISLTLFPVRCPCEIVLTILSFLNPIDAATDLCTLELISRSWYSFLCSSAVQFGVWLPLVRSSDYLPTAADWTESAAQLRSKLDHPIRFDWRRFHYDVKRSPNMQNRARIKMAVKEIDHELRKRDCL